MQLSMLSAAVLAGGATIDVDGTLIIQLGIFTLLFLILQKLVFGPMLKLFAAREASIDGARDEAKRIEREVAGSGAKMDDDLRRVRAQASEERDRLRGEGLKLERTLLDNVRRETQGTLANAKRRLDDEAASVRVDMKVQVPRLSKEIASRLLGREVQ